MLPIDLEIPRTPMLVTRVEVLNDKTPDLIEDVWRLVTDAEILP